MLLASGLDCALHCIVQVPRWRLTLYAIGAIGHIVGAVRALGGTHSSGSFCRHLPRVVERLLDMLEFNIQLVVLVKYARAAAACLKHERDTALTRHGDASVIARYVIRMAKLSRCSTPAGRERCINTAYARIPTQRIVRSRYIPRIGASLSNHQPFQLRRYHIYRTESRAEQRYASV